MPKWRPLVKHGSSWILPLRVSFLSASFCFASVNPTLIYIPCSHLPPVWIRSISCCDCASEAVTSQSANLCAIQYFYLILVIHAWHSSFPPEALFAVNNAYIFPCVTGKSFWAQHDAWSSPIIAILMCPVSITTCVVHSACDMHSFGSSSFCSSPLSISCHHEVNAK